MKTFKTWLITSVFSLGVLCLLPQVTKAINPDTWEGYYSGEWVYTYDTCYPDSTSFGTGGTIYISLDHVTAKGKIKSATVYYDNNGVTYDATGKIYRKNGKKKIKLNYSTDEFYSLIIKGTLYKKTLRIKGKYDHIKTSDDCHWGGTVDLTKYSDLY